MRILAIVPIVGAGTAEDPKRPKYAPKPGEMEAAFEAGLLAFTSVLSDDGKLALVEVVARDRAALREILGDRSIRAFIKGVHKRDDIEAEFKKHKKDFDFNRFGTEVR